MKVELMPSFLAGVNMKKVNCLVRGLVACVIALAMVSTVAAQAVMDGAAKVVRIKGTARYMVGGGAWQPLKAGIVLKAGTVIQTAKDKAPAWTWF